MKYHTKYISIISGFFLLFFLCGSTLTAQDTGEWAIPGGVELEENPTEATPENIETGQGLYEQHCKSCHGTPGENNPIALVPQPKDPASDAFQNQTDGAIFYKMSEGRGPMPQFKDLIAYQDKWYLINFLRSVGSGDYPGADSAATAGADTLNVTAVEMAVTLEKQAPASEGEDTAYIVKAKVTDKVTGLPAAGIPVGFYVQRTFGQLPVGEAGKTNSQGVASIQFPTDLPGDSTGNVMLIVKIDDESLTGNTEYSEEIAWGEPTIPVNLLDERSMWTVRSMAPIWLILSFLGVTGGVWLTIFYVISLIVRIKKVGDKHREQHA